MSCDPLDFELHAMLGLGMNKKAIVLVPSQARKDELIKKYDIPRFIQSQIVVTKKRILQGQEQVFVFYDEGVYKND